MPRSETDPKGPRPSIQYPDSGVVEGPGQQEGRDQTIDGVIGLLAGMYPEAVITPQNYHQYYELYIQELLAKK